MNTYTDKTSENKSQSVAKVAFQKEGDNGSVFTDNRPEAIAQRKLQEMASNSSRVKQLKSLQAMADSSPKVVQTKSSGKMPGNKNVVQLYPVGGVSGAFVSAPGRPGGHSNAGTKDAIIDDIFSRAPRNDFEAALKSMTIGNAKIQLRGSWLSTNNCAICHKQPISDIENRIVAAANHAPLGAHSLDFVSWIGTLFNPDPLGLLGSAAAIAAKIAANTASAAEISELISLIDRSPSNLFIGDSPTNSGIGAAFDFNLDVSDPTDTAPAPASPRSSAIYAADHAFAPHIGHAPSSPRRDIDSTGDAWVRSSGASGWVHSNQ